ncbi:hypothetical protein, partial [Erythrobacter sp. YJ-T3-07]|uniref:hypothetical protein n=1 Tax=Erythrobacter sp. YJ-T3-07 TaxID=2793063 RepID=UPI001F27E00D
MYDISSKCLASFFFLENIMGHLSSAVLLCATLLSGSHAAASGKIARAHNQFVGIPYDYQKGIIQEAIANETLCQPYYENYVNRSLYDYR